MENFNRRKFIQRALLVGGAFMTPAVVSAGVHSRHLRGCSPAQFLHGIASGDPLSNAVILWTRATPNEFKPKHFKHRWFSYYLNKRRKKLIIGWEVSTTPDFSRVIRRGRARVTDKSDYTLKVDVVGLKPGTKYYYRFRSGSGFSPVGTTRTLPEDDVSQVKLAAMSCSNYPAGYFNAYTDASKIPDLDAVVHLGDYIYEYGDGEYATELADEIGRSFNSGNDTEILTLEDYRNRYAQYRTDSGLQALHAAAPFICVWDDHEVSNDTWREGAENHSEDEGDFFERKAQALQAYFEWLPIRPVIKGNNEVIYRQFHFGNLVNLMMLDTRVIARDKQLDYTNYIGEDGNFDGAAFVADVGNPNRTLLGSDQLQWLQGSLIGSQAKWQVLGQQVLMGNMPLPAEILLNLGNPEADLLSTISELTAIKGRMLAGDPTVTDEEKARVNTVLPYNLDAWDGYAYEREVILQTALAANKDLIVLAGDTHNAWANNLKTLAGDKVGVEYATSSVTSPGLEDYLQLPSAFWADFEAALTFLIDNLKYFNTGDRGYMVVTFNQEEAKAAWVFVDNILSKDYSVDESRANSLTVPAGAKELS